MLNTDPAGRPSAHEILEFNWFESLFPDRNVPEEKRKVVDVFGNAMDDADEFDGFDDDEGAF